MRRNIIKSTGRYLPEKILTNKELESIVETTDEWILQRTGIEERHIAADGERTSDMAVRAAQKALDEAGLAGSDIDGVIVATATPDRVFPSVAVAVQAVLGVKQGACFDVQAACAGFVYALGTADALMKAGHGKRFLVIGAEKFSSIVDWEDRRTCVLFGDGAGAVILEAIDGQGEFSDQGILDCQLHADGTYQDMLYVDGGIAQKKNGHIQMQGQDVFKFAVNSMSEIMKDTLHKNNLNADDIDWLVPHQANIRIIEATGRKLGLPSEKVVVTVNKHGNTSAASIPLALDTAITDGRIKRGDVLFLEGLGGGFTWASALVRY